MDTKDPAFVRGILGPTRYKYWKGGKLELCKMVIDNKVLSLDELRKIAKPIIKEPTGLKARMTKRQLAALKNKWVIDKQARSIAEKWEKKVAQEIEAEHITGNRPFDMFLNNEFIEFKTVVKNDKGLMHQVWLSDDAIKRKKTFMQKYKVRGHQVVVDVSPGSETYGQLFYRKGIGRFRLKNMESLGNIGNPETFTKLQSRLMKGARKFDSPPIAKAPKVNTRTVKQAENWAKKEMGIEQVDYDDLDNELAQLFNQYLKGAYDEYGVKPRVVKFDRSVFVGKNKGAAALSFEDGTMAFNPDLFTTVNEVRALMQEQAWSWNWLSTSDVGHVFKHEFGHLRYFQLGGTEASASRKLSKKTLEELYKGIGRTDLPRFISKYALKSEGEFYAEMMAKIMNGEPLHPVVKKVITQIEKRISKGLRKKVKRRR